MCQYQKMRNSITAIMTLLDWFRLARIRSFKNIVKEDVSSYSSKCFNEDAPNLIDFKLVREIYKLPAVKKMDNKIFIE